MSRFCLRARCTHTVVASLAATVLYTSTSVAQTPSAPPSFRLDYESAFSGYRPLNDLSVGSWRDANDNVTRIGGWREYLKEVQRTSAPASPPTAPRINTAPPAAQPTNPPLSDPHAGHRRQ